MSFGVVAAVGSIVIGGIGVAQGMAQQRLAKRAFNKSDPFGPYREKYATALGDLMDDPTGFLNNPLYKAAFDEGMQGVMRAFTSKGFGGSGNMATGLQKAGMSFGWGALQDQQKLLSRLSGADIAPNFDAALRAYAGGSDTIGGGLQGILGGILGFKGG